MSRTWARFGTLAAALVLTAGLAACSDGDSDDTATDDSTPAEQATADVQPTGELTEAECVYDGDPPVDADCYELVVPETHGEDGGATLTLPVAVVHPPSGDPAPDPIVAPSGGPGYDDVRNLGYWSGTANLYGRDVIVWDQRGTGLAEPSLDCPEREEAFTANFEQAESPQVELAAIEQATTTCRARLVDEGIDLEAYDTVQNAYDAIALRGALGYEQWNILGASYGSRLGLELMRLDADGTRAAVLDSAYPPGVGGVTDLVESAERAFQQLFDGCEANATCAAAHPDLEQTFHDTIEQYRAEPVTVAVTLDDGTELDFAVTGTDLYAGLFNALYDLSLIPALPSVIESLAAGDTTIVPELARQGIPFVNATSEGMYLSVDCNDNGGLPDERFDETVADADMTTLLTGTSSAWCETWDVDAPSGDVQEPVTADVPALVLAGTYDPITPPQHGEAAADALPDATFVSFDGVGHGVDGSSECADEIVAAFWADPTAELDVSCAEALTGPDFS